MATDFAACLAGRVELIFTSMPFQSIMVSFSYPLVQERKHFAGGFNVCLNVISN